LSFDCFQGWNFKPKWTKNVSLIPRWHWLNAIRWNVNIFCNFWAKFLLSNYFLLAFTVFQFIFRQVIMFRIRLTEKIWLRILHLKCYQFHIFLNMLNLMLKNAFMQLKNVSQNLKNNKENNLNMPMGFTSKYIKPEAI